jgi:hypothetical protein
MHLQEMSQTGSVNGALLAAAKRPFEQLSGSFSDAGIHNMLSEIYQQLSNGCICSVRRLEIEILQAGKVGYSARFSDGLANRTQCCLPAGRFFGQFVPETRVLCDRLYEDHDVGATQRGVYHELGVGLIESLIPEFDNPPPVVEPLDDIDAFFHELRFGAGSAAVTSTADLDLQMAGTQEFDFDAAAAQLPTPPQFSTPLAAMNGTESGSAAITFTGDFQMAGSQVYGFGSAQARFPTPPQLSTPPAAMNGSPSGFTSADDLQMAGLPAFGLNSVQAQLSTPPAATSGTQSGSAAVACTGNLRKTSSQMFVFGSAQAQPSTPPQFSTPPAATSGTPSGSAQTARPAGAHAQKWPVAPKALEQTSATKAVKAPPSCHICGYRPKGDPQWFKGSMAKHMKLQHSTEPPKIYKCPYPGCTSQYKNRPDNLRQHQLEKNHWVEGDEVAPRRPSKRRKPSNK